MTGQRKSSVREYPPGHRRSSDQRSISEELEDRVSSMRARSRAIFLDSILKAILHLPGYDTVTPTTMKKSGVSLTVSSLTLDEVKLLLSKLSSDTPIMLGSSSTNSTTLYSAEFSREGHGISVSLKWSDGTIHQSLFPEDIISDPELTLLERTKRA